MRVFASCTFDQVKAAYANQVRALIAGGSDILLVETIFDSLNAKAALVAIQEVFEQDKKVLPIMISAAVGRGGETMISAQTIEAYWNAMKHVKPLAIGLELFARARFDEAVSAELAEKSDTAISCYPNAGLPNPLSPTGFDLKPEDMGAISRRICRKRVDQHRRWLLRQHARTYRGHCEGAGGEASAGVCGVEDKSHVVSPHPWPNLGRTPLPRGEGGTGAAAGPVYFSQRRGRNDGQMPVPRRRCLASFRFAAVHAADRTFTS